MPFGLCNAPATYQRLMESMLGYFNYQNLLIYLDDISLYSASIEDMVTNLDVLLEEQSLKFKPSKCLFFMREINYLGHVVSEKRISCDPQKTEAIDSWPTPTSEKELRTFLGLAGFYRCTVPRFSKIAAALNALLGGTKTSTGSVSNKKEIFNFGWSFAIRTGKAATKVKRVSTDATNTGIPIAT